MKTKYLYNICPIELENKLYFDALAYKLEAGRKLYKELYYIKSRTEEECIRLFYIRKAILHTEKLLSEREG